MHSYSLFHQILWGRGGGGAEGNAIPRGRVFLTYDSGCMGNIVNFGFVRDKSVL